MQKTRQKNNKFRQLLLEIPKTEIHLHLEGLASVDTLWELHKTHNIVLDGINSKKDLSERFKIKSLDEFVWVYINILQDAFRKDSDIRFLMKDAANYLKRNNIVYAEIHFAPSKFIQSGLSFKAIMNTLQKGADALAKKENIEINYIIDVSRSYGVENALENLELTLKHMTDRIIGIGLGGTESTGPAPEYKEVFDKAIEKGLQVVAHAGEDVGPVSIWDALNYLNISRIGHGISAFQDEKLMDYLQEKQIPLEICPTSNIFTRKYVTGYEDHPIRAFYDHKIYVTVNTDDPTLFSVDLIDEYMNLLEHDIFTESEILTLVKNNLFATFMNEKQKKQHWKKASAVIEKYGFAIPK